MKNNLIATCYCNLRKEFIYKLFIKKVLEPQGTIMVKKEYKKH